MPILIVTKASACFIVGFLRRVMTGKVEICGVNTSDLPKLTDKESVELLSLIAGGDDGARERFIIANIRLVLSVIKRFWSKKSNFDDLFQAGMIGLIKAIDNFDLSVGVKFSTYAVPMILGETRRFIRESNSLRVARSIRDKATDVLRTRTELEKKDIEGTAENIAKAMNIAVSEVAYYLDAISDTVSLYEPVYSKNGDELLLMDSLGDQKNTDESWTEKVALDTALKTLNEREREIIYLRYYEGKTQTEISEQVGISQAQVSRLEKNALMDIKARMSN